MLAPTYALTATERVLPRLALDFTSAALDPRITVTRALDTATRVNSSGFIETVNADLPRFDYDPTTLVCRGLLVEETRTNLLLYSAAFNEINWAKTSVGVASAPVVTANAGIAPDGTMSADRAQLNLNGGTTLGDQSNLVQTVTFPAGSTTFSVWLKSNTGVNQNLVLFTWAGTASVITVTSSWQRFTITATTTAISSTAGIRARGTQSQNAIDVLIWGAQLEAGAFATSYIPTTTTSLTRNADVVAMTGTNFSSWWQTTAGAAAVCAQQRAVTSIRPWLQFDDTTADNIIALRGNTTNPELYIKATTDQAQIDAGTIAANTSYILTGSWDTNNCAAAIAASAPVTDTSVTIPVVTRALIGSDGTNYINGWLSTIRYWPQRLTNAETQAFSKL